jgi:hypothetical protein
MPKESQTLKNSHGGYAGKSIIEKLEEDMDKRRKVMGGMVIRDGTDAMKTEDYLLNKGRYQGLGQALARMRGTKLDVEIASSNERLGIE